VTENGPACRHGAYHAENSLCPGSRRARVRRDNWKLSPCRQRAPPQPDQPEPLFACIRARINSSADPACGFLPNANVRAALGRVLPPTPSVIGASAGRPYPQTNGWTFWMYSDNCGALVEIDRPRQNYLAQKKLKIVPMS
jgi:hypothetical protein